MEKIAVVTGSSSGIGFETSLALARDGYFTYATMRDLKKAVEIQKIANEENLSLEVLELDVDDEKSAENAINTIIQEKGRIDVLVNNAGWGLWGTAEDVSLDEFRAQFETSSDEVNEFLEKNYKEGLPPFGTIFSKRIPFTSTPFFLDNLPYMSLNVFLTSATLSMPTLTPPTSVL